MVNHTLGERELATRPDRIDFRDRVYQPRLVSLPHTYPAQDDVSAFLERYRKAAKILDQEKEGACTGFALAAVINFIEWERWMKTSDAHVPDPEAPPNVSARMLYDIARAYDEWEGEAYSGSSCRGAMKGWHKHGVCAHGLWPRDKGHDLGSPSWRRDALLRPLGAYYRVEASSIPDLQAAIHEVSAVYCSARIHEGWDNDNLEPENGIDFSDLVLPVIDRNFPKAGGHAFAMVGYTNEGFIVQNSWGEEWGTGGFALLTYADWLENGYDAWVAALSAPMSANAVANAPVSVSKVSLVKASSGKAMEPLGHKAVIPAWSEDEAYRHSVVMGNEGKLLRRMVEWQTGSEALNQTVFGEAVKAIENSGKHPSGKRSSPKIRDVVLYAHGGLMDEEQAVRRARRLGAWFEANAIYPIFMVWRTSLRESLEVIGTDMVDKFVDERDRLEARSDSAMIERQSAKLQDQFDKTYETLAEKIIGKAVWSQVKHNAKAASDYDGGARQVSKVLHKLIEKYPDLRIHLIGHSAGALLLGEMLEDIGKARPISSVTLMAPACSVRFTNQHYGKALEGGQIEWGGLSIHNLTDRRDRRDTVGPYGRSFLYLIHRALEATRKTPILGLQRSWLLKEDGQTLRKFCNEDPKVLRRALQEELGADLAEDHIKHVHRWHDIACMHGVEVAFHDSAQVVVRESGDDLRQSKRGHASLDHDTELLNATIARILGKPEPPVPVTDLTDV